MKDKARRMELRTADGKVILVLYLYEEIALEDQPKEKESPKPDAGKAKPQNSGQSNESFTAIAIFSRLLIGWNGKDASALR